jgi:hypothetical protein
MSVLTLIIERVFGDDGRLERSAVVADLRRKLDAAGGAAGVRSAGRFVRADSRTADAVLVVPAPLADVLPAGGVPHGYVVSVASSALGGSGATSLLLALMSAQPEAWIAVVGMPDFGALAAAEMGVDLSRLGLIPDPGPDLLQVISALADGVDVIAAVSPMEGAVGRAVIRSMGLPPARQRVLTGRLRQGGAVLLVAGRWPGADLVFTVREVRWSGIGQGYGRLRDRELDVRVAGRRAGAALGATVTLRLRAGRNSVMVEALETAAPPLAMPLPAVAQADAS